jgi:hypothetical protein
MTGFITHLIKRKESNGIGGAILLSYIPLYLKIKIMSCSGGKSTAKGRYNKANNLKQPTGYTVDNKGNVKPIYK